MGDHGLTNEPVYQGEPILAVVAVDEVTAVDAIEKIQIDYERLPFVVDPLETLRPGGPNARTEGNVWVRPRRRRRRRAAGPRLLPPDVRNSSGPKRTSPTPRTASCRWARRPMSGPSATSTPASRMRRYVMDHTFVTPNTSHSCLETRTAMAYWQNGKVYVYTGTQSTAQTVPAIARWLGIDSRQGGADQRIYRRRFRQQGNRGDFADHSGAAREEGQRAGDDAHQPRGRVLHRPRASRPAWAG